MRQWNLKYGTLPVKNGTDHLLQCITGERLRPLLSMISRTLIRLPEPSHGWKNYNEGVIRMWSSPWWVCGNYGKNVMWLLASHSFHSNIIHHFPSIINHHFPRPVIRPILSLVGKWTLMRQMHMRRRMESCTWKHRLRIRTTFGRYLWKLQRAYQRRSNNQNGRHFQSCHKRRSLEIVAKLSWIGGWRGGIVFMTCILCRE